MRGLRSPIWSLVTRRSQFWPTRHHASVPVPPGAARPAAVKAARPHCAKGGIDNETCRCTRRPTRLAASARFHTAHRHLSSHHGTHKFATEFQFGRYNGSTTNPVSRIQECADLCAARKAARHERVCGLGLGVGNCQTEHAELEYAELTYDEYLAHTPRRGARRLERQVQRSRGSLSLREGNRSASDRTHLRCLGARHGRRNERRTERMPRLLGSW